MANKALQSALESVRKEIERQFVECYTAIRTYTVVSQDRCLVLYDLAGQTLGLDGAWFECGVYRGGTAMLLATVIQGSGYDIPLHLFDTFQGMPEVDPKVDRHRKGDFHDTDVVEVMRRLYDIDSKSVIFHQGFIPDTFEGLALPNGIALAHVDVDIFKSVWDCCEFIYPRLVPGGFLLFDDYRFPKCPGAKKAVDEFFSNLPETPQVLPTRQALVVKGYRPGTKKENV